ELCGQGVRVGDVEVRVPAGDALLDVSSAVRHCPGTDVLEHQHRGPPLDNAEEDVVRFGPLKRYVEPETIAIERQRRGDTVDDEERRDAGNVWLGQCEPTVFPVDSAALPRPPN